MDNLHPRKAGLAALKSLVSEGGLEPPWALRPSAPRADVSTKFHHSDTSHLERLILVIEVEGQLPLHDPDGDQVHLTCCRYDEE